MKIPLAQEQSYQGCLTPGPGFHLPLELLCAPLQSSDISKDHSMVIPAITGYALRLVDPIRKFTQGWAPNLQAEVQTGHHNLVFGAYQMALHNTASLAELC